MSQVYMCDSCGEMFSANSEGWRQFEEKWNGDKATYYIYNNAFNHGMIVRHVGPCCAFSGMTPKPRMAIEATKEKDGNE